MPLRTIRQTVFTIFVEGMWGKLVFSNILTFPAFKTYHNCRLNIALERVGRYSSDSAEPLQPARHIGGMPDF